MVDWILALAVVTFLCVIAFLIWNKKSTAQHTRATGDADPLSGSGNHIRKPDELRASLDAAAARPR